MKTKLLLFAVLTLAAVKKTTAQSADEKAVKQAAKAETQEIGRLFLYYLLIQVLTLL